MIIYIHGFGGSGQGGKAQAFRKYFKSIGEDFIAPSLPYNPELAIKTLEELINSYKGEVYLIGSSLGGFYTTYLAKKTFVKKAIVINPVIKPYETLKRAIGNAPNFFDDSYFFWNDTHLNILNKYKVKDISNYKDKIMLLVQKGDELLDYKEAVDKFVECRCIIEDGGNHSFVDIQNHFKDIEEFFEIGNKFKHTTKVKGVGLSNTELANRIGDLYYDDLAIFLEVLSKKLNLDSIKDKSLGRTKLATNLKNSAKLINQSAKYIDIAWDICTIPTIKWLYKNGYNGDITIGKSKIIPKENNDFSSWKELRFLYCDTNILPYMLDYDVDNLMDKPIDKYLESKGWMIKEQHIKPEKTSYGIGDCDWYHRWMDLKRYIAIKENLLFYFDVEIHRGEEEYDTTFHYGDDTKEFIEREFKK